jgi:FecR protein
MKKTETDEGSYLWDGSGEPDPEVVRLETLLGQLRHQGEPPSLPVRQSSRFRRTGWIVGGLSAAATVLLAAGIAWYAIGLYRGGWSVQTLSGAPVVDGVRASGDNSRLGRLRVGKWLETDAISRARIEVAQVGRVEVDPNTRLQLVEARGREQRMSLSQGTIHARIWAPPKIFFVNTPSATAIDLGCEYTLQVDFTGAGLIRVTLGWVSFEGYGRESYIPDGAIGTTRPGAGPGTPYYEDAPSGYGEALTILDYGPADDPRRAGALDVILTSSRRRDALTLWHLLSRGTAAERERVYDRLAVLAPPPQGVTRSAVLAGEKHALEQWWDALGLEDATWWKLWKKAQ